MPGSVQLTDEYGRSLSTTDSAGNPAGNITESPTSFIKYNDGTYEYYCEAAVGTARSTSAWRILRKTIATGDLVYCGDGSSSYSATDVADVAEGVGTHTYTLSA